ncbi:MAG: aldehyde reductase [Porticoccaceae bacterium]|nr:aldehyde reductase [Porticoccaceae bacterium]
MGRVLVTGATGFIGLHCIQQLLNRGYSVNGTVRSLDRKGEVIAALLSHNTQTEKLSLFEVDLNSDSGWNDAITDCDYVLHVASPFVLTDENEDFFVKPAVDGVLRALKFSSAHNVKKVVLTSSFAAIHESLDDMQESFNEDDWSDPDKLGISFYAKSKTMAELAAWDFMKTQSPDFGLTVINPVLVMGPSLSKDIGTSNSLVKNMISGSVPGTAKIHIGVVDVRDVASAHVLAMENRESDGERIIVSERELWIHEVAVILRNAGFNKTPKFVFPKWLMKIVACFRKDLVLMVKMIGRRRDISSAKAKDILGWNPLSAEVSIIDTAKQLKEYNLL